MHEDLTLRLNNDFCKPSTILHARGDRSEAFGIYTANRMLAMLEKKWALLMSPDLVYTLNYAVKLRNSRHFAKLMHPRCAKNTHELESQVLPRSAENWRAMSDRERTYEAHGLANINSMPVSIIMAHLYEKIGALDREKRLRGGTVDYNQPNTAIVKTEPRLTFSVCHQANTINEAASSIAQDQHISSPACSCPPSCHCAALCRLDIIKPCICMDNPLFTQCLNMHTMDDATALVDSMKRYQESVLFEMSSNDLAQMEIARLALPNNRDLQTAAPALSAFSMRERTSTSSVVGSSTITPAKHPHNHPWDLPTPPPTRSKLQVNGGRETSPRPLPQYPAVRFKQLAMQSSVGTEEETQDSSSTSDLFARPIERTKESACS